jgi:zinc protease
MISLLAAALAALAADRTSPPEARPIPAYKPPSFRETTLANGLSVVALEDARFPLITVRLSFRAGMRYDPVDLPGLSESVAALITEGTQSRDARQLAEELAGIGGDINGVAGPDGLTLAASALSENTDRLLELLADVARNASFPESEVRLYLQNRQQELMAQLAQPAFLAARKLNQVVFGSSPYAHLAPTMESLGRIDRKAAAGFRDRYLVPNNAFLVLLGRLPSGGEYLKLVEKHFGGWQRKAVTLQPVTPPPPSARQIILVDRPGSVQADIHVGRLAVSRGSPDYFPLMIGTVVLGGGASSRMNLNIREKQGFAYDAHAALEPKRDSGIITAVTQVRNEVIQPALKALVGELDRISAGPVTAEELTLARNYVSGVFLLGLETQRGLADQLSMMKITGLPDDYLQNYTARIRGVSQDNVLAVAKKYIDPAQSAIIVVGDASKIRKPIEDLGPVTVAKEAH